MADIVFCLSSRPDLKQGGFARLDREVGLPIPSIIMQGGSGPVEAFCRAQNRPEGCLIAVDDMPARSSRRGDGGPPDVEEKVIPSSIFAGDEAITDLPSHWEPVTEADEHMVAAQLGRRPRGLLAVVSRDEAGSPEAVLTAPLFIRKRGGSGVKVEVFPTQFWLTSPVLYAAISSLEAEGWIERLEARLERDGAFHEAMVRAHRGAAQLRRRLVSEKWLRWLEEGGYEGQLGVLLETGVAGIRGGPEGTSFGVKCLHAHYADWLGRGDNPVGRWVAERLASTPPADGRSGE